MPPAVVQQVLRRPWLVRRMSACQTFLRGSLDLILIKPTGTPHPIPRLVPLDGLVGKEDIQRLLCALLRPLWGEYDGANIRLTDARVDDIRPIVRVVERCRLSRIEALLEAYKRARLPLFAPALVESDEGVRLLVPPVVEYSSRGMELIDGAHRLYRLRELRRIGKARIKALMVERPDGGQFADPAGMPCTWRDMRWVRKKLARTRRFVEYRPDLLRPVGSRFSDSKLVFANLEECKTYIEAVLNDEVSV